MRDLKSWKGSNSQLNTQIHKSSMEQKKSLNGVSECLPEEFSLRKLASLKQKYAKKLTVKNRNRMSDEKIRRPQIMSCAVYCSGGQNKSLSCHIHR